MAAKRDMLRVALKLAGPVFAEEAYTLLLGSLTIALLGLLGPAELVSFTLAISVQSSVVAIAGVTGTGAAILAARELGSGNWNMLRCITGQTISLGIVTGSLLTLAGRPVAQGLYLFTAAEPEIARLTGELLQIFFLFTPFYLTALLVRSVLRGIGETGLAFLIIAVNSTINIAAIWLLIQTSGPGRGIYGAAWGTGFAAVSGAVFALAVLFSHRKIRLRLNDLLQLRLFILRRIISISLPVAWEQIALQIGFTLYSFELAAVGAKQFAGSQIAQQLECIPLAIGCGFSVAVMTIAGQSAGRKSPLLASRFISFINSLTILLMTIAGILVYLTAEPLIAMFTNDHDVACWAAVCVFLSMLEQPTMAIGLILGNALRGFGDTKWPAYSTICGMWLVRLPLTYALIDVAGCGIAAAWIITAADHLLRGVILIIRFRGQAGKYPPVG